MEINGYLSNGEICVATVIFRKYKSNKQRNNFSKTEFKI